MKWMTAWITFASLLTLQGATLVQQGRPESVIVIPDSPVPSVTQGAQELVYHVKKATGAELKIVSEKDFDGKSTPIYLGNTARAKALGKDVATLGRNQAWIKVSDDEIIVAGNDAPGPWLGGGESTATLFAVYDLLEKNLGVRWMWPGELGTFVPQSEQAAFQNGESLFKLPFAFANWRVPYGMSRAGWSSPAVMNAFFHETELWKTRNRFNIDLSLQFYPHGFVDYWEQYGKSHPEFFNLLPDGQRRIDPFYFGARKDLVSMCVSNPALHREIVKNYLNNFDPRYPQINLNENDTAGKCVCDLCLEWDDSPIPAATRRAEAQKRFEAKDPDWYLALGDVSNRYARFYLAVLDEVDRVAPEKKARIAALIYANYSDAPSVKLNNRIFQRYCPPIMFPWTSQKVDYYKKNWKAWADSGVDMMMRPNFTWDGHSYPIDYSREYAESFRFAAQNNLASLDYDSLTGQFGAQGFTLFTIARLAVNPELTLEEIKAEYARAFGKAGNAVTAYFDFLADTSHDIGKRAEFQTQTVEGGDFGNFYSKGADFFDEAFFAKANGLLDQARRLAADDSEALARVEFLQLGLTNAELTAKVEREYRKYKAHGETVDFAAALNELDGFRAANDHHFFANVGPLLYLEGRTWPREMLKLVSKNMVKLPVEWPFTFDPEKSGEAKGFQQPDFNHADWEKILVNEVWEKQPVGKRYFEKHGQNFDGHAWYRLDFDVPAAAKNEQVILLFGAVDEGCEIWVNGKKLLERPYPYQGNTNSWQEAFEVDFTSVANFGGKNTVAVKVIDDSGNGGIWKQVFLKTEPKALDSSKNLIDNGSFEKGMAGWEYNHPKGVVAATIEEGITRSGRKAGRLTVKTAEKVNLIAGKHGAWGRFYRPVMVKPGQKYKIQAAVRSSNDFDGTIGIWVRADDAKPGLHAGSINLDWGKTNGQWQLLEGEFTAGQEKAMLYLNLSGNSGSIWFDDIAIVPAE